MLMLVNNGRWEHCRIRNGNKILLDYTNINIKNSNSVLHLLIILNEYLLHHLLLVLVLQISLITRLSLHLLYNTSSQTGPRRRVRRLQIRIHHRGVMIIHIFIRIRTRIRHIRGAPLLISRRMGDGGGLLLRLLLLVGVGVGVNLDLLVLI